MSYCGYLSKLIKFLTGKRAVEMKHINFFRLDRNERKNRTWSLITQTLPNFDELFDLTNIKMIQGLEELRQNEARRRPAPAVAAAENAGKKLNFMLNTQQTKTFHFSCRLIKNPHV